MDALRQDLRYAMGSLRRAPFVYVLAALSLAVGIAANSAIFSAVDVFLFRPLPYEGAERIVRVHGTNEERGWTETDVSLPNLLDLRAESDVVDLAVFSGESYNVSTSDRPVWLPGMRVSHNYFDVLAVQPALGRVFLPEEERAGADGVVVLTHGAWQTLGGDPSMVGATVLVDAAPRTVVGVLPESFRVMGSDVRMFTPLGVTGEEHRGSQSYNGIGRIRDGATMDEARSELSRIAAGLEELYPETNRSLGVQVITLQDDLFDETFRLASTIVTVAVLFVLLIACVNVANLLLARAADRGREIAVRAALGAERFRISRQLFLESLVLAAVAGIGGLLLSIWGIRGLVSIMPPYFPRVEEIGLDGRVVAFTAVIALGAGVLFGLVPAIQASRPDLRGALGEGARGGGAGEARARLRRGLVVAEIALAMVLLVSAGLMIRGYVHVRSIDPGFRTEDVLTFRTALPAARYDSAAETTAFFRDAVTRLGALPGVERAGAAQVIPWAGSWNTYYSIPGEPEVELASRPIARYFSITPGFLETLEIEVLSGRGFTEADREDATLVALVSRNLAELHWPDEDPVGRQVELSSGPREIVGVVEDTHTNRPDEAPPRTIYLAAAQTAPAAMTFVVRAERDPGALAGAARSAIAGIDPDQPIYSVQTYERIIEFNIGGEIIIAQLLGIFAVIALLLAVVGVYGVLAYSVTQRTRELGIRGALGADRGDLVRMVVRQGTVLGVVGVGIGLVLAALSSRALSVFLFGISALDPLVFAAVTAALLMAAVTASWLPARRAAAVEPIVALRAE
jgi:putative ABC transport system permease protein